MNQQELQAQYTALLDLKDVIQEWIRTKANDPAHAEILFGLRELYRTKDRFYVDNGGEGHCPPV